MRDIQKLDKTELLHIQKKLQLLSNLRKDLWKRGTKEYYRIENGTNILKVEYFPFWKDAKHFIEAKIPEIYKKFFNQTVDISQVEMVENVDLQWGMRIFFNDMLCDLSYSRFWVQLG